MGQRRIESYDDGGLIESHTVEFDDTAEVNGRTIEDALVAASAALQAIIDAPAATVTTLPQAQAAVRDVQQALRVEARVLKRLIRRVRGDLSGSD